MFVSCVVDGCDSEEYRKGRVVFVTGVPQLCSLERLVEEKMSVSTLSAVEIRDFKHTKHNFVTVTTLKIEKCKNQL